MLAQPGDAGIMRAVARRLTFEEVGIAVEPRSFGEEAADIIAGTVTKKQRHSILDHGQVAAVSGHKQVGRR